MATQSASPPWTLLNALRASGLPADRVAYLLATLILLRWADFQDAEEEAIADFEGQPYRPALDSSFHWRSWSHLTGEELRQRLDDIKVGIDLSRPNSANTQPALAFVWDGIHDLTEIDETSRTELVRWLADQPFETPADRLDLLRQFDALLDASTNKATGQFRTPSSICELMVGLVVPRAGESVYDPCFGSAGLLTASVEYVNEAVSKSGRARGETALRISGVELNLQMFVIGFARLILSGVADPQLVLGNSLEREHKLNPTDGGFDVIVANPPFGGRVDPIGLGHLPIQTSDITALFIQHALGQLKPGGRAAIVVPQGLLFRSGADREFRRWLIQHNGLEAVISLGSGAFEPYSGIQASILLIRRVAQSHHVRFIDAESLFDRSRESKGKTLSETAIKQIVEAVESRATSDIAWTVTDQEIARLEWDLTVKRRGQSDFRSVLDSISKQMPVIALGDLATITTGVAVKSQDMVDQPMDGLIPLIRTKDIERGVASKPSAWLRLGSSNSSNAVDPRLSELSLRVPVRSGVKLIWGRKLGDQAANLVKEISRIRGISEIRFGPFSSGPKSVDGLSIRMSLSTTPNIIEGVILDNARNGHLQTVQVFVADNSERDQLFNSLVNHLWSLGFIKGAPPEPAQGHGHTLRSSYKLSKAKLLAGDILASKSGTIGKSGVVRNGAIGAIASSGLYRIRVESNQVDPHYLLAYLNSPKCRSWLSDQATGATIQHLPIGVLRELSVPIPPLQIQRRIAEQFREQETDALGFLAVFSGASERDPISAWAASALRVFGHAGEPINEPLEFSLVERLVSELKQVRNQAAHDKQSGPLASWILSLHSALSPLQGIQLVPKGASMLSLLLAATAGIAQTEQLLPSDMYSDSAEEADARRLGWAVTRRLRAAIDALSAEVDVDFAPETVFVRAGSINHLSVRITNVGTLPLRKLEVTASEGWGQCSVPFLGEGESSSLLFVGYVQEGMESLQLEFIWTADSLGGRSVQGKRQVVFHVDSTGRLDVELLDDLGSSPYVCGDPVRPDRNDVFFGREELLEKIRRTVARSGNVVLLEGNRRAGKSSILWHLVGQNSVPGWLGVYCSLQGAEGSKDTAGVPTVEVFRVIASSIAKGVHSLGMPTPLPNGAVLQPGGIGVARACREGISESSPFSDLREYVESILDLLLPHGLGILLMLDEFDKLQEGIESGVTSPQVPENIRYLIQSYPRFSAILTGSRRMKRLREEYWSALFGLGTREGVTALEESEALRLVTDPVKGRLTYTREAVDHLIRVSACQPFVLQCLCNRVFDLAADLNARSIGLGLVERASHELIQGWEHFASIWDYAKTDRRRFILALCQRDAKESDPVTLALLREHLAQQGIDVSEAGLNEDLEFLRELELLDFDGETDTYSLTLPLMGDWIDLQQDFEVLRTKAIAESLDAPEDFSWTPQNETRAQVDMLIVDSWAELEEFPDSKGD